ncbi:dUTP diphosphatase [Bartonella sp. DGB2]|uniref:dUTP diphosphatase n=1 Tax=Bartonella sp. DGB2 TaxID=3388426 RepID=UPI00398F919C
MTHSSRPKLAIMRLETSQSIPLPAYESAGAAGFDLRAALKDETPLTLKIGKRVLVPTGLIFEIPSGYEIQIRPRSGLALKYGITCLNTPGTVDSDYRGEIKILLINHGEEDFVIEHGMRIAQGVLAPAPQAEIYQSAELSQTERGSNGYGSTGHH